MKTSTACPEKTPSRGVSTGAHLVLGTRPPPLEEMLDSEAHRRLGSSRRGAADSSSSTTKPLAVPGEKRKPCQ